MFFKYNMELTDTDAKKTALICRQYLVRRLIEEYKKVEQLNNTDETPELKGYLRAFLQQIETINVCSNSTDEFSRKMQTKLDDLRDHSKYQTIAASLDACLKEITMEIKDTQQQDRFSSQNKIAKIKNHSLYILSIPMMGMIAGGAVLAFSNPVGMLVLGVAAAVLIVSQSIYWITKYQEYKTLNNKLTNNDLEIFYTEGYAVPLTELPSVTKAKPIDSMDRSEHQEKPVIISTTVDNFLNTSTELASELATEVAAATYDIANTAWSNMWSALKKPDETSTIVAQHLHNL